MSKITWIFGLGILASTAWAAGIPAEQVTRPEGSKPYQGDAKELVAYGETLWNDPKLSKNGKTTCASCHVGNTKMFKKTFLDNYPHQVAMAKSRTKMTSIDAEQMVQLCMLVPMKSAVLGWETKELAALAAYTVEVAHPAYVAAQEAKK